MILFVLVGFTAGRNAPPPEEFGGVRRRLPDAARAGRSPRTASGNRWP